MQKMIIALAIVLNFTSISNAQELTIVTPDSVKLYVKVKGVGIPCLYIHGGPGSGSYWLEKFFGDYLEQHFQMVYLDQRGVGRSTSPTDQNYTMNRMVNDFETVRKKLDIKDWILLGHSFGGILQMGYIDKYPEVIKGMIMINCCLNMKESFCESWIPHAAKLGNTTYSLLNCESPDSILNKMMEVAKAMDTKKNRWKMAYSDSTNAILMKQSYKEIPNWNNDMSSVALGINEYWKNFALNTSQIEQPVLFFYGQTDWMVGSNHYKGINFPNMILWGSNVGHMPFMENRNDLEKAIDQYISKWNF